MPTHTISVASHTLFAHTHNARHQRRHTGRTVPGRACPAPRLESSRSPAITSTPRDHPRTHPTNRPIAIHNPTPRVHCATNPPHAPPSVPTKNQPRSPRDQPPTHRVHPTNHTQLAVSTRRTPTPNNNPHPHRCTYIHQHPHRCPPMNRVCIQAYTNQHSHPSTHPHAHHPQCIILTPRPHQRTRGMHTPIQPLTTDSPLLNQHYKAPFFHQTQGQTTHKTPLAND